MKKAYVLPVLLSLFCGLGISQSTEGTNSASDSGPYTGKIYRVGGAVSPPRVVHSAQPEPQAGTSQHGQQKFKGGTVRLSLVVDPEGNPRNMRVIQSLSPGLDQKAIEAVSHWKFDPAKKNKQAVAVQIDVDVNFDPL